TDILSPLLQNSSGIFLYPAIPKQVFHIHLPSTSLLAALSIQSTYFPIRQIKKYCLESPVLYYLPSTHFRQNSTKSFRSLSSRWFCLHYHQSNTSLQV